MYCCRIIYIYLAHFSLCGCIQNIKKIYVEIIFLLWDSSEREQSFSSWVPPPDANSPKPNFGEIDTKHCDAQKFYHQPIHQIDCRKSPFLRISFWYGNTWSCVNCDFSITTLYFRLMTAAMLETWKKRINNLVKALLLYSDIILL